MKNLPVAKKGGSSKQYTPYETPDNLQSINTIKILIGFSDGEVEGTFSARDVYFDDVPVIAPDGTANFPGTRIDWRPGTQSQTVIPGIEGAVNQISVNREITADTPYTISVTNKTLSAVRVKMYTNYLQETTEKGDRTTTRVEYAIDMAVDGGTYKQVIKSSFNGKTTTGADRDHRINIPTFSDRVLIRVRRITPDSTTDRIQNKTYVNSYAEIIDAKFRYPLTALLYVEVDSKLFPNQIPNISVKKKLKIVRIPSNYDPESRTYSGTWDGSFKWGWTNNPAWIIYDICINNRYGLDQRDIGIPVDKWSLYELAQFCDQKVPDGKGGFEHRSECNVVIQEQVEAYTLIRDLAAIGHCLTHWNGEMISFIVDKPRQATYLFTNENVIDGAFKYSYATNKTIYTACDVTFDDEENNYAQDVQTVFDNELNLRHGFNRTELTAIGCTRRSEAHRRGDWILKTNSLDKVVSFSTGMEGMIPMVGEVIAVCDKDRASARLLNTSGRIYEVSGLQVFFKFKVDARPGDRIMVNNPDGVPVMRTIASVAPDGLSISLNVGFGFEVQPMATFAIDRDDIALQYFVITSLENGSDDEKFIWSITATEYNESKYDAIDYGVNIDRRPTSNVLPDVVAVPENVKISSYSRVVQGMSVESMVVSWDKVDKATTYEVQWRRDSNNWINVPAQGGTEVTVDGIYSGLYYVRVRAHNEMVGYSGWSDIVTATLTGKVGKPAGISAITASEDEIFGIRVKWGFEDGAGDTAYTELQQAPVSDSGTVDEEQASLLSLIPYPQHEYWHSILPPGYRRAYRARLIDRIGNVSDWSEFALGMSSIDTGAITDSIMDEIKDSDEWKNFEQGAIKLNANLENVANASIESALAGAKVHMNDVATSRRSKAYYRESIKLIADETQARVDAITELGASFSKDLGDTVQEINATFTEVRTAMADADKALAQQIEQVKAEIDDDVKAQITRIDIALAEETQARTDADTALSSKLGDTEAALNNKMSTWASVSGAGAIWQTNLGLKYNGQEYSAGMALRLDVKSGVPSSQVLFIADRFAVVTNASGGGYTLPFAVQNGQVIINNAVIGAASIQSAQLADWLQSTNYVAGSAGLRLNMRTGNAEFNDCVVRGTVIAKAGQFSFTGNSGVVINSNGVTVNLSNGGRIVLGTW